MDPQKLFFALVFMIAIGGRPLAAEKTPPAGGKVQVQVVEGGESLVPAADCRQMLVGPGVNQPDPYPGYGGFVGWEAPLRLSDGTLLVVFSAGYWHGSLPTPLQMPQAQMDRWHGLGMPKGFQAPRGGRAMIMRSTDNGRSWSKPKTLVDTPWDDRHPNLAELPDGSILATFFTTPGQGNPFVYPERARHTGLLRSTDGGQSWEKEPRRLPSPLASDGTDGPAIVLADGSIMVVVYGPLTDGDPDRLAVFRSTDLGESWNLLSIIKTDHHLKEPTVVQLADGRLVVMARPEGDITWSDDGGHTWTPPVTFGMRMYEPGLLVLPDGTLLCLHGSYGGGGFRALLSGDGGHTWKAPADDYGFAVDSTTYGYGKGIVLPDGSVYAAYIHTGGHRTEDARNNAIWGIRLKVRADQQGIDLLPAVW